MYAKVAIDINSYCMLNKLWTAHVGLLSISNLSLSLSLLCSNWSWVERETKNRGSGNGNEILRDARGEKAMTVHRAKPERGPPPLDTEQKPVVSQLGKLWPKAVSMWCRKDYFFWGPRVLSAHYMLMTWNTDKPGRVSSCQLSICCVHPGDVPTQSVWARSGLGYSSGESIPEERKQLLIGSSARPAPSSASASPHYPVDWNWNSFVRRIIRLNFLSSCSLCDITVFMSNSGRSPTHHCSLKRR